MSLSEVEDANELFEEAPCGYLTTDAQGVVVRANRTLLEMTGYDSSAVVGRRFHDLLDPGSQIFCETHLLPLLNIQGQVREVTVDLACADGTRLPVLLSVRARRAADGPVEALRLMVLPTIERRRYEDELRRQRTEAQRLLEAAFQQASTDELTGLPNRRVWQDELPRRLDRARQERTPVTVAVLDLDHFKRINDTDGHAAGDALLRDVGALWQTRLRRGDLLARYGGEEFVLLLQGCPLETGVRTVERLRRGLPRGATCSAGVAEWDGEEDVTTLMERADRMLYEAKRAGRDRVCAAA